MSWVTAAEHLAGFSGLGVAVTALNHKFVYHTMKQCSVVITLLHQLYEVVAVEWGVIVEQQGDVSHAGFKFNMSRMVHFVFVRFF